MTTTKHFALTLAVTLFALLATVHAQTPRVTTVNISAEADKVHISAIGDVSEIRVEVSDEAGDVVFQSGAISGQELNWNMRDASGERVARGTYLFTVTFRNAMGKLRKRVEQVIVAEDEKANAPTPAPNAVQATVMTSGTTTTGKIPKFASASTITNSVMTESLGRIGIGTAAPASTLTVAGMIQTTGATTGGIKFPDNTVQKTAATGDITSVVAGSGLTGGATTGAATLAIGAGKVTNTHLATNAVTATKIATGQVVKSINSLKDNVTLAAGSNIIITPSGNTLTINSAGGGGLDGVTHDATLDGNGTDAEPLGLASPLVIDRSSAGFLVSVTNSAGGGGISGSSNATHGVSGTNTAGGTGHAGVYGVSTGFNGFGVFGEANNGTNARGVHGQSTSGYAGYFEGLAWVTGDLHVGGNISTTGCTGCNRVPSDRNIKANFSPVSPRFILNKLAAIPIETWNYKSEPDTVRHIGPMAQDFSAAFGVGTDDKHISTVDAEGVTMAAIQGLYQMMQEKDRQIKQLQSQVVQLQRTVKQQRVVRRRYSK
jgi:hypothetical protein